MFFDAIAHTKSRISSFSSYRPLLSSMILKGPENSAKLPPVMLKQHTIVITINIPLLALLVRKSDSCIER
jgi:hypothetical protein